MHKMTPITLGGLWEEENNDTVDEVVVDSPYPCPDAIAWVQKVVPGDIR